MCVCVCVCVCVYISMCAVLIMTVYVCIYLFCTIVLCQDCKVMIWTKDESVGGKWNSVVSSLYYRLYDYLSILVHTCCRMCL